MLADKFTTDDKFGAMLAQTLRLSSEPVPEDFTERALEQIRCTEERKILTCKVLKERFALAGCIILGAAAVLALVIFPESVAYVFQRMGEGVVQYGSAFINQIP
jgi:uncharacterized cysteine cluster protein YcgN (CxxCxxCC family)